LHGADAFGTSISEPRGADAKLIKQIGGTLGVMGLNTLRGRAAAISRMS
jgi:hypothetical protein